MDNEQLYTAALLHFLPFGPRSNARLFAHFGSAETIWNASPEELQAANQQNEIGEHRIIKFITWRANQDPYQLFTAVKTANLDVVCRTDDRYPAALSIIADPPLGFLFKGTLPPKQQPLVSIVGSRRCTSYGLNTTHKLTCELVERGLGVVSGLAYGIDECAHKTALNQHGYTLAVIAQGHNTLTGRQHHLAQAIIESGGAIVSEYPANVPGSKHSFPIRNRIIAGWCPGTVVIEAEIASGTLRTAQSAVDSNRDVFAVPGPIDSPASAGANRLIKDGAHVVTCANDVIETLQLSHLPRPKPQPSPAAIPRGANPLEQLVIELLAKGQKTIDQLARTAGREAAELLATLTCLELEGKVRNLGNMEYGL